MINRILTIVGVLSLLMISSAEVLCQSKDVNQKTIVWTSASNVDLKTGQPFKQSLKFITHTNQKIELAGRLPQFFLITSVKGEWKNVEQPGSIFYEVEIEGQKGLAIIKKEADETSLEIDLSISSPDGIHRKYIINSVKIN
jgi:hypothetical protein